VSHRAKISREEILARQQARREEVARLTHLGLSCQQIAAAMHVTARTVHRDRAAVGITEQPYQPFTEAEYRRAEQLLDEGCSYNEVARTLGRNPRCIRRHFPGRGWTSAQRAEYISLVQRMRHVRRRLELAS
jgi:DNA-binding CsgD family transcriptional regulator